MDTSIASVSPKTAPKTTQRSAIEYVIDNCTLPVDIKAKFEDMLESIAHRSTSGGVRKPTARQNENAVIKDGIVDAMEDGVRYAIGDMLKQFAIFDETFTSQRVSALVSQLVEEKRVNRIEDKRKAYFVKA